jgi:thiol-disulfide isomerase/thioredoxin
MRIRWTLAGIGALALAAVAITSSMPWLRHTDTHAPGAEACPVDAPAANLDFTLKDLNNADVRLADFKGKVILLDFWATWCGPCKVEIPGFVEMQNAYGPEGLQVVGISIDDRLEQLKPFADEMKMNYPVLQGLGRDDVTDALGPIYGVPTTLLISREGKVCATHAGMTPKETFERQIKELL